MVSDNLKELNINNENEKIGKAQIMQSVFFPFPYDKKEDQMSSQIEDEIESKNDPMIESDQFYSSSISNKTPTSSSRRQSFLPTPDRIQETDHSESILFTPKENTLFPEDIPFPPKKRFQTESEELFFNKFNQQQESNLVEYDNNFTRKLIPLNESLICDLVREEEPNNNFAATLGRSFRVGFGPGGLIATQFSSSMMGNIIIDNISAASFGTSANEKTQNIYESQLRAHIKNNTYNNEKNEFLFTPKLEREDDDDVDMFDDDDNKEEISKKAKEGILAFISTLTDRLQNLNESTTQKSPNNNNLDPEIESIKLLLKHSIKTWKLINSLWGEINFANVDGKNFFQCEPELFQVQDTKTLLRCRYLLSEWGQDALRDSIFEYQEKLDSMKSMKSGGYLADSLLNFLCGHQLQKAIDLTIKNNEFRLATVISQSCNILMREQMRKQIKYWQPIFPNNSQQQQQQQQNYNQLEFIEPSLSKLYYLLGGEIDQCYEQTKSFDWLRCFFLFFWYGEKSNTEPYISYALDSYRKSNLFQLFPPTFSGKRDDDEDYDILYHLISYFASSECEIWDLLNPKSYCNFQLEFSTSWFVFTLLTALLQRRYHTKDSIQFSNEIDYTNKLYRLTIGFANQLEMLGLFHWSIYVLSHLPDKKLREKSIQQILNRNGLSLLHNDDLHFTQSTVPNSLDCDSIISFLTKELHVPEYMINVAKACACSYNRDYISCLEYLLLAKKRDDAHYVFIEHVAPHAVLQFHIESASFLHSDYVKVPNLLRELKQLMETNSNGEGAYKIYYDFFSAIIEELETTNDDLPKIIDLVRSRLQEIKKYTLASRYQLERVCLSDIPSQFAENSPNCDRDTSNLALGGHRPMPSASQFSFFDYVTNAPLRPR